MSKALTESQIKHFRERGFLTGLPVFDATEMARINAELPELLNLLNVGESTKEIREWHETSLYLFELCMEPRILDYVESLLGPNFYLWASNFFIKEPHTHETVGWHQDAYYWPLKPIESLTVWLAFDDVDEANGAMTVIPGSHRQNIVNHARKEGGTTSVLHLEADVSSFDLSTAERIPLKCGSISIHDDKLLHASPANPSDRRRAGFTIRYSPNHVTCDLSINPHFRIYPARGEVCTRNPHGTVPTQRFERLHREHLSIEESGSEAENKFWQKM